MKNTFNPVGAVHSMVATGIKAGISGHKCPGETDN
jgi:hypothetical protein